ncbi:hypothetical protein J6590_027179 [Homalodisca vitripennis]|nr:hypothetical protein J6590_027179 [Homalodisca vitripennis]
MSKCVLTTLGTILLRLSYHCVEKLPRRPRSYVCRRSLLLDAQLAAEASAGNRPADFFTPNHSRAAQTK